METTTVRHTEQDGTVVVESVATPTVNSLQPVFDALVKAVADRIMVQVLESQELETKISMVMDTVIEDKLDIDREIYNWMSNNFDIDYYRDEILQMNEIDANNEKPESDQKKRRAPVQIIRTPSTY